MKRILLTLSIGIGALAILYLVLLCYPGPLFSVGYEYHQFEIHSNELIPEEIESVLDDVERRISNSELYSNTQKFSVYLCQSDWMYFLFSRNLNSGGICNFSLSRNVFIRECDIKSNQLIPPENWVFPLDDRPLSYFIAHELTHSMQSNMDRFMNLKVPGYIMEGYADYIAKSTEADMEAYWTKFYAGDPIMDPENGLYNKYHLFISYFIDQKCYTFSKLIEEKPDLDVLEALTIR